MVLPPYYVIRLIWWIFVFICLFITFVAIIFIIEHGSKPLITNKSASIMIHILKNIMLLGIIMVGMAIVDRMVMYQINNIEMNHSNDEIAGSQKVVAFINKQMYLLPLYIYVVIFALILLYFVLYILSISVSEHIDYIKERVSNSQTTHNFSKIINAMIISMVIIVPVHFICVSSYQILRGTLQLEHVKDNYKKIKNMTMLFIVVTIFILRFNIESFYAWSNLQKIPYIKQKKLQNWTLEKMTFIF